MIFVFLSTALAVAFDNVLPLKKTTLVKGITASLPESFLVMTDDDIAQKYPTYKKPLAMYNSADKTVDFGVNASVNKWGRNLSVLRDMYKSTIMSVFNNVDFTQEGVIKKINERDFIIFEFVSELTDEKRIDEKVIKVKKYSYLAYTVYENNVLIFNFTCAAADKDKWYNTAGAILNSVVISSKLKIEAFQPFEVNRPMPKGNDAQMQMIRKMQDKKKSQ